MPSEAAQLADHRPPQAPLLSTRKDSAEVFQRTRAVAFGHKRLEVQLLQRQD
jgi:hypothetical protein